MILPLTMIYDLTDFIDLPLVKPICQSTKLPLKIIYCLFIFSSHCQNYPSVDN